MDKKTFIVRLKKLEKEGFLRHKKRKYYLVSRNRRSQYRELNIKLNKFKKKYLKLKEPQFAFEQLRLLDNIFQELYHKLQYERLCFWSDYAKGEKLKIEEIIKKCEKLITEIADNIKAHFPEPSRDLLPPEDVIFITKVSKA